MVGIYYFTIFNNISGIYSMKAVSLSILFILFCSISAHSDYFLSWPKKGMLLLRGGVAAVVTYGFALRAVWEISLPILKIGKETAAGTVHATYAVLEFSWGLGVNQLLLGSAVPISGYAWTTVVDGPMSLLGRAPTPSSADGWWVVMIEEENRHIRQLSPTVQRYVSIMEW